MAALTGRSSRRKQERFRVEGPQAVRSLLAHRADLAREVFATSRGIAEHPELQELARAAAVPLREVDEQILRAMVRADAASGADGARDAEAPAASDGDGGTLVSPQGVLAVGALPAEDPAAASAAVAALPPGAPVTVVVLHEVRDPGNVGTLVRTADAAGADLVLLTRTSADPFSPKAVRAAVGSLFHLPVITGAAIEDLLDGLGGAGITAAATSGHAATDLFDTPLPERLAWIVGNEARGLDAETLSAAPLRVRIPLLGHAESLNVHTAASVCLFETVRRRRAGA
ncbi:RNA methyltransferase [Brachybacterium sp. YJGR34]|uniref:TrmH family RNA methyltransferase n=1 Tax=Brachybacterium sp. YJGR34 TaxID=2059911 RepID=UPI001E481524|nr:RNA methyltransferase [Brachybacterium sp. YJGR34]